MMTESETNSSTSNGGLKAAVMSELDEPLWAVISFDRVESSGVSYAEASELIEKLNKEGVAGLCIVTIDAAERAKH
ncbi:MAG TPA: hypothetical protein PLN05_11175 [Pyrinomonadaceae bacterium]|nr:hypothetical protein [Pyrinomonadaceae bacterium]HRK50982.1 hypothetical protein [Pyrinomonadaceae bacterium]